MSKEVRKFLWSVFWQVVCVVAILTRDDVEFYDGFLPSDVLPHVIVAILGVVWWFSLAHVVTTGLELLVWRRLFGKGGQPRQRKLLTDLANILIYLAAGAIIVVHVFKQPITGLFATSGIIAIVVGLALQNTLGDLFSGLALNIERPYKAGDWITIDNVQGMVMITNWRATHLRTRTGDIMIVPNSVIARGRMVNHAMPSKLHLANVEVPLRYGHSSDEVQAILSEAALAIPGVSQDPKPIILMHELGPAVTIWRCYFFTEDFGRLVILRGLVAKEIYDRLGAAGLDEFQPRENRYIFMQRAAAETEAPLPVLPA